MTDQATFGECPVCGEGTLVAMKHGATNSLLLMCDDCESQWRSPAEAESYKGALTAELRGLETASMAQLSAAGWRSC